MTEPKRASLALLVALQLCLVPSARTQTAVRRLSLDDAIVTALGRGEEVSLAQAGVRSSEAGEKVARSGMFPQLSASAVYTRTLKSQYGSVGGTTTTTDTSKNSLASLFKNFPFGKENQWTLGLTAAQAIFAGGRLSAQVDAAEARTRSAEIDLTAAQAQLALSVTQSYFDAVLADTLVRISSDALRQAGEVYRITDMAFKVGEKAEFDALRAKVARDNQVPMLLQAQNDRAQAYYRLKQLLNISLDDSIVLTTPVDDSINRFSIKSDTATELRATVRQANEAVHASDAQVRLAESARWPLIGISSTYSPVAYPDNFFPNNNDWLANWTASLNISVPIYTGGSISGNIDMARAGVDQANARLEQARESAAMDSRVSLDGLATAEANLRATAGTASEATRAYDIAHVRFTQGISTEVELDDARIQEEQARANWARAVRNYQVARAKLSLLKDLPVMPAQGGASSSQTMSSSAIGAGTPQSPSMQSQQGGLNSPSGSPTGQ